MTKPTTSAEERERLAAGWLLSAWNDGKAGQRQQLLSELPAEASATSPVRVQALPMLVGAGDSLSDCSSDMLQSVGPESARRPGR